MEREDLTMKKSTTFATLSLIGLNVIAFPRSGWSQQAAPPPQQAASPQSPNPNGTCPQSHHKQDVLLGACVGQSLLMQNPPVVLTPGQAPTADVMPIIKAALQACRAQANPNINPNNGSVNNPQIQPAVPPAPNQTPQ